MAGASAEQMAQERSVETMGASSFDDLLDLWVPCISRSRALSVKPSVADQAEDATLRASRTCSLRSCTHPSSPLLSQCSGHGAASYSAFLRNATDPAVVFALELIHEERGAIAFYC